jgi:hypothetical protein
MSVSSECCLVSVTPLALSSNRVSRPFKRSFLLLLAFFRIRLTLLLASIYLDAEFLFNDGKCALQPRGAP